MTNRPGWGVKTAVSRRSVLIDLGAVAYGHQLSRAEVFRPSRVPVVGRFSLADGRWLYRRLPLNRPRPRSGVGLSRHPLVFAALFIGFVMVNALGGYGALMLAQPLIGWAMVSASGRPVVVFGAVRLP
ncbi:hypothetical protein ACXDF8_03040 [Mycolicibacterium sp. CBM1]